jgi:hypothetical protein
VAFLRQIIRREVAEEKKNGRISFCLTAKIKCGFFVSAHPRQWISSEEGNALQVPLTRAINDQTYHIPVDVMEIKTLSAERVSRTLARSR